MSNETYVVPDWPSFSRCWKIVAIVLAVLLLLMWLLGYGPGGKHCQQEALLECHEVGANGAAERAEGDAAGTPVSSLDGVGANADSLQSGAGLGEGASDLEEGGAAIPAFDFMAEIDARRVYFNVGESTLDDIDRSLVDEVVGELGNYSDAVVVLSGFHDPSGSLAANQALAKNRALSVRDYLLSQGVSAERVLMEKPALTTGTGSDAEARRVEVRPATLQ